MSVKIIDFLDWLLRFGMGLPQFCLVFAVVFFLSFFLLRQRDNTVRYPASFLFSISACILIFGGIFSWLLRMGIGIGNRASYGRDALKDFLSIYIFFFVIGIVPVIIGVLLCRFGRDRKKGETASNSIFQSL